MTSRGLHAGWGGCVALVLLGALMLPAASSAASQPAAASQVSRARLPRGRVLVVTLPRLTWERLDAVRTPTIDSFLSGASLASLSTRTVGARTSPGAAYVTIGAGNRATTVGAADGGEVLMAGESTPSGSAAEVYERRTGRRPTGRLLSLDFPAIVARNEILRFGAVPGSLGAALAGAGFGVGAVGNADGTLLTARNRQIGLAAADRDGQVPAGDVGPELLTADPLAPFGVRTDPQAMHAAVRRAWDSADVLFVEMSDLERAEQARVESTPRQADEQYDAAVRAADRELEVLLKSVDPRRDLVMLVAPSAPIEREQLTVFASRGPHMAPGWAISGTTRRDGYVTLTDMAATILDYFHVRVPDAINDTPVSGVASSRSVGDRVHAMIHANRRSVFRDDAFGTLTVAFIALLVLMLALVAWAVARRPKWSAALSYLALVVMSLPSATYLGALLPYSMFSIVTYGLALLTIAMLIALCVLLLAHGDAALAAVLSAGVTVVVLLGDVITGAYLQLDSIFGYSPIVAGRFAGYGNQAFSLLGVSTLLVAAGGWQVWTARGGSPALRLPAVLTLFTIVVVLDGAPSWGSDVGGVLAAVPAFAVCAILLTGRRIRVRSVAVIAAATLGVLALFAAVDLARPVGSRTHLGRFADKLVHGEAGLVLSRKLNANLSVLSSTVWTWVIPVALLFFAYLTWRPNSLLHRINGANAQFRAFGVSAITLGVVAWALNDSGVSMPAMMLAIALPYTAILALGLVGEPEPEPDAVAPDRSTQDAAVRSHLGADVAQDPSQ